MGKLITFLVGVAANWGIWKLGKFWFENTDMDNSAGFFLSMVLVCGSVFWWAFYLWGLGVVAYGPEESPEIEITLDSGFKHQILVSTESEVHKSTTYVPLATGGVVPVGGSEKVEVKTRSQVRVWLDQMQPGFELQEFIPGEKSPVVKTDLDYRGDIDSPRLLLRKTKLRYYKRSAWDFLEPGEHWLYEAIVQLPYDCK